MVHFYFHLTKIRSALVPTYNHVKVIFLSMMAAFHTLISLAYRFDCPLAVIIY